MLDCWCGRHSGTGVGVGWIMIAFSDNRLQSTPHSSGTPSTRASRQRQWWVVCRALAHFCSLCRGSDHPTSNCALAYLHGATGKGPGTFQGATSFSRPKDQCRRHKSILGICVSWNKGNCVYPGVCTYRHICATCHQSHMARDCDKTVENSEYKRHLPYTRLQRAGHQGQRR